jgi:hypothetical protein
MEVKNFVITEEYNDNTSVTLLFKAHDETDAIEKWRSFYVENAYHETDANVFETGDDILITFQDIQECTDDEMKVLEKFCSKMY